MHSNRVNLAAAAFLVILGIVSTGIVASAYTSNPQNKGPESPISLLVPASIGSGALGTTTVAGSYSAPLGRSQPHYFLQEGKASTGTLPSFSSNDVTYHGGPTMHISISYTIFWLPRPNKMFHVFTGYGIESCFDPTNFACTFTVYCAYHDFFTKGSQSIIYSNMPDFNGVTGHCTPRQRPFPNSDSYADPEINILSHELFEAVSDPQLNAWTDSFSNEIGDKCAWNFGNVNPDGSNLLLNGHNYLVQLEWSNYGGCALSYGPSHEVMIAPSPGSSSIPSTVTLNITYTSQGSKWWTTTSDSNGTLTISTDQSTPIAITNKATITSQTEKWCFNQNCTDVSFDSGDAPVTTYYYFDLLAQQVSVSTANVPSSSLDFATGTILPDSLGFPQRLSIQLTQTSQTIWVQRGTTASVASPTSIGINTRWVTRVSTWTISAAFQIPNPIVYTPQYLTTFQYTVSGGGSYSPPSVTYYDAGLPKTALAGSPVWADGAAAYDYQSQLPGSTPYERWSTIAPNGIVSAPGAGISTNYYHQYAVTLSYQVIGGNAPTTPSLTGNAYGLGVPTGLSLQPSTIWLDAGSTYSLTNALPGTGAQERWYAAISNSGLVSSPMILSPTYSHQYFLSVSGDLPGSTGQGWYDAGSSTLATTPRVYESSSTSRIRLTAYSEDGGSPISLDTAVQDVSIGFQMNSPHTLLFSSTVQYSLTNVLQTGSIGSMTSSAKGDSWYDTGTSIYIVLYKNWDAIGNTRQSLVSYSIDNIPTSIDRTSSGSVDIPVIIMTTSHVLSDESITQYFISVQGASLSGSQTGDGWFDTGSHFTIQGAYTRAYTASMPYHIYGVPVGFQILANTTISSVLWTSSSNTLTFSANNVDATIYVPKGLDLTPNKVSDDGTAVVFSYSSSNDLLSFKGSSGFQVSFSSTSSPSSVLSVIPDSVLYPIIIAIAVGVILTLGFVLMKRQPRKAPP